MTAYPTARYSPAVDFKDATWHDAFVKLYLGHSKKGTVLVPAQIFAKSGSWRFYQPSFFGPCFIGFEVEPNLHAAQFTVDVTGPRGANPIRLLVEIKSVDRVKTYADGAQLYACRLAGPSRLAPHAAGRCQRLVDDFRLTLFHHTNKAAYSDIISSNELWTSAWNLQGSRKLRNIGYAYFTSLPKIETADDLSRIAMASNGIIQFQTTSTRRFEQILDLKVYRESTTGRTSALEVEVDSAALAPPHLLLHPFVQPNPAYYEIVNPEVFRVGLFLGAKLAIPRRIAVIKSDDLKRFEYIVLGDASELDGLAAPYDEEDTGQIMHLERLDDSSDLFEFWRANQNSDQMSGRVFEARQLEESQADPATLPKKC
jgi:hypothetical protein